MMQASVEEGRAPLTMGDGRSADNVLADALTRANRLKAAVIAVALFDILAAFVMVLSPFAFDLGAWSQSQITGWSFDASIFDWLLLCWARDLALVAVLLKWGVPPDGGDTAPLRWVRRGSIIMFMLGITRIVELDWKTQRNVEIFTPLVVLSALASPTLSVLGAFLLRASCSLEKARLARTAAADAEAADEDTTEGQYSSSMTLWQIIRVLKPYFWPSTGTTRELVVNRTRAVMTWVCVLFSKVCSLVAPIYLAKATNLIAHALKVGPEGQAVTSDIIHAVSTYAFLCLASKCFKEFQSLIYIKVQQRAYIEIADDSFRHLHNLSLDWHLKKKMGNVIRSVDRGIAAAQQTMQYVFLNLVPTLLEAFAVTGIFLFHFANLRLAVFMFMNLAAYLYFTIKITQCRKQLRTASTKHDNNLHDRMTDSLVNYETIKYFTAEDYERKEYVSAVTKFQDANMATSVSLSGLNIIQQIIVNFSLAGGLIITTAQLLSTRGNLGDFVSVNTYIVNVYTPLNFLGTIYNMMVNAVVDMHNFGQLLAEKATVTDARGAHQLDLTPGSEPLVEFRNVFFNYAKQPSVRSIKNVSFKVPPGLSTAFVGPTGSGKTTITRLLFRFYDAVQGQVFVNGQNVKDITQKSLRQAIGMVPQDVVMFNATIAHNIRYGRVDKEGITQAEVQKAAEGAQLEEFIGQQPSGYETIVGERGLKLSGGEKQRLAIARCLMKDPPIVILDEATSALDTQTEQRVQQALDMLSSQRTVIAIAHRLSTVRNFDEILVLDAGSIVERGTHESLLALESSRYASMWEQQLNGIFETRNGDKEDGAGLGVGKSSPGPPGGPSGHGGGHGHGHGHGHGS